MNNDWLSLDCRSCGKRLGFMTYAGPTGAPYCDACKAESDREDAGHGQGDDFGNDPTDEEVREWLDDPPWDAGCEPPEVERGLS